MKKAKQAIKIISTVRGYKVREYKGYRLDYLPPKDDFRIHCGGELAWCICDTVDGEGRVCDITCHRSN